MSVLKLTSAQLEERLSNFDSAEDLSSFNGVDCVIAESSANDVAPRTLPACPVISLPAKEDTPDFIDVVVEREEELQILTSAIEQNPVASATLVQLLRHNEVAGVLNALFAESLAYSTLQHCTEFETWLDKHVRRPARPPAPGPAVQVERTNDQLELTLNRPRKRNAWSIEMRDGLCEALHLANRDVSVRQIVLQGNGPCFGAGGDLDEFGDARDAGVAHVSRMIRSAGYLMHCLREKITAKLHGACIGAGIELPAFAKTVLAREDAFFQLPEVGMGLIPGAGGTASILNRIGKQRLNWMALSGTRVDAETAKKWGLVDHVVSSWEE